MKISKKIQITVLALVLVFGIIPGAKIASAQTVTCGALPQAICNQVISQSRGSTNPLAGLQPVIDFIANIIVAVFGMVAVLVMIISGVQISASAGNDEVIKKAKENIFKVVTAMVLLISFRAIIGIVQNNLFAGVSTTSLFTDAGGLAPGGIPRLFANVISIASFASGAISVIFVIVGGIRYVMSAGSSNALTSAKKTITYALAGLVLSISAYGIVVFIQQQLQK